jgi:hypothetical protein
MGSCFPIQAARAAAWMGHPGSPVDYEDDLLLDAKQRTAVGGQDEVQRLCAGDVLLVPDVVHGVRFVFEVEEHPGKIG